MSLARDLWMTPGKRRLIRRTVANGPYAPPDGTMEFDSVDASVATKLTVEEVEFGAADTYTVGDLVIFLAKANTGTQAARLATDKLRAIVESVASPNVTFSIAPTDLSTSGIDFSGLVLQVIHVE